VNSVSSITESQLLSVHELMSCNRDFVVVSQLSLVLSQGFHIRRIIVTSRFLLEGIPASNFWQYPANFSAGARPNSMKFLKREVREVKSNYYRCENLTTNLSYTPIVCSAESSDRTEVLPKLQC